MKKIVKFKNLLIILIFFNISIFVAASPTTTASILLLNSKESNKNEEKSIEQVNEEFKFLYENKNDLLKTALKLRPDRLIVGEVGKEALNMLIGWNSGHPGGLSIIDAEDARGGLRKLEQYVQIKSVSAQELISSFTKVIQKNMNLFEYYFILEQNK